MASGIGRRRAAALNDGGTAYRERRQKIIAAAAGVFQEKGFGAASLGDVAIALGTDRASLYYYVSSKEELFHEVVHTAAEDSVLRAEAIRDGDGTTTEKLSALVQSLLMSFEEHYPYLYVYIQEKMSQIGREDDPWASSMWTLNRRYDDAVMAIVQEGIDSGELKALAPARVLAYGIVGMVNWSHRWFRPTGDLSAKELADAYVEMLLSGLRAGNQRPAAGRASGRRRPHDVKPTVASNPAQRTSVRGEGTGTAARPAAKAAARKAPAAGPAAKAAARKAPAVGPAAKTTARKAPAAGPAAKATARKAAEAGPAAKTTARKAAEARPAAKTTAKKTAEAAARPGAKAKAVPEKTAKTAAGAVARTPAKATTAQRRGSRAR
jgi:AcrR family transcriptional regulator